MSRGLFPRSILEDALDSRGREAGRFLPQGRFARSAYLTISDDAGVEKESHGVLVGIAAVALCVTAPGVLPLGAENQRRGPEFLSLAEYEARYDFIRVAFARAT